MSEWHPIESAPKDGTHVLVFRINPLDKADAVVVGFFDQDWKAWHTTPGHYGCTPTHWMPLPEPPVQS